MVIYKSRERRGTLFHIHHGEGSRVLFQKACTFESIPVYADQISGWFGLPDGTSLVYLRGGMTIHVDEDAKNVAMISGNEFEQRAVEASAMRLAARDAYPAARSAPAALSVALAA